VFQEVALINRSDRPCTLSGGPTAVTGVRMTGGITTLTRVAKGDGFRFAGPGPANLRPGQSGWVTLSYADGSPELAAGGKAAYRALFIVVDGGGMPVEFPAVLNLICSLEASGFGAPPPPPGSRSLLNVLAAAVANARQDKFWVQGAPDGEWWEVYTVLDDSQTFWGEGDSQRTM
jgi:hypothetical protein